MKLAAIADDLTGANDLALQFAKRGIEAQVQLTFRSEAEKGDVVVVDSDSRDLVGKEAYEKVAALARELAALHPACVYKKIDSTLRGDWATEVLAADDAFQPELVVIAPAYPAIGRTTVSGHHLLGGTPLECTEIGLAPKTPVKESYIPAILGAAAPARLLSLIDYRIMQQGAAAVRQAVDGALAAGRRWLVFDITVEADFDTLLQAMQGRAQILWVGSAGLADHLPAFYGWRGAEERRVAGREGPVLVCAGSVSHVTQTQTAELARQPDVATVELDIARILEMPAALDAICARLRMQLAAGRDVLLTAARSDDDVARAVAAGKRLGLAQKEVSERVAQIFAAVTSRLDLAALGGLVLTGGDTGVHVCRSIGADAIRVLAEVEPGVPLGKLAGAAEPLLLVTKAGAFGTPDVFEKARTLLHHWGKAEAEERKAGTV